MGVIDQNNGRESPSQLRSKPASASALRRQPKALRFFPKGFRDDTYVAWERGYKWATHSRWEESLSREEFRRLLRKREFSEVAAHAVPVDQSSRHSMLFSDAV